MAGPFVMRLVTLDSKHLHKYTKDTEMLHKAKRPCVLVVKLKYYGNRYSFAVPLRSNISPASPKNEYFSLPPRSTTHPGHHHGIHYIKMFPVRPEWMLLFHTEGNLYEAMIKGIIDSHEKQIISECQEYLSRYEAGERSPYATDLDLLLKIMNQSE